MKQTQTQSKGAQPLEGIEALRAERSELDRLLQKGVSFEVTDYEQEYRPILWGLFKRKGAIKEVTRTFTIDEPTLGVLDRIAGECIDIEINEADFQGEDAHAHALRLVAGNAKRCARILAFAVLGNEYLKPTAKTWGGVPRYEEDTEALERLTSLFYRRLKPSELARLYMLVNTMCNLGDFMLSIRLMSANRTTQAIRIEGDN